MLVRLVIDERPLAMARSAALGRLLEAHPGSTVVVLDPSGTFIDPEAALSGHGISLDGHVVLRSGALIEYISTADAPQLSSLALEVERAGSGTRSVRLRTGELGDLHMTDIAGHIAAVIVVSGPRDRTIATPVQTLMVASPRVGVIRCDVYGRIKCACAATSLMLGRTDAPIDGMAVLDLVHPDDHDGAIVNWLAAKEQRGIALRWRCRLRRGDGSTIWVETTLTNGIDSTGAGDVVVDLYDISEEVAATDALAAERELLGLITETLPVGVAKFDVSGRIEHANAQLGLLLAPHSPHSLIERAVRGDLVQRDLAAAFRNLLVDGAGSSLVLEHQGDGVSRRHLEWTLRPVLTDTGEVTGGVVCVADVTEAHRLRSALEQRAITDPLTGCLNRAGTTAELDRALAEASADDGVGLLFIDLDAFKGINDALGHATGDAVLQVVADRLRGSLRQVDQVGRLGGDEFVVIAPRLSSRDAALALARRVSGHLDGPAIIGTTTVTIAASVGVAWTSGGTVSNLLGAADAAMYAAKQSRSPVPVLAPDLVTV